LYLVSIVLLALLLRLPRFLTAQVVLTEGTTYVTIARNLAAGRGYVGILGVRDFFVPPLYPLLIAALVRLGFDAIWAGRLLSLILGALLPLPLYWLTREMSGRRVAGLFASLLLAFHPLLIIYASRVWSETTYSFLLWCGLWCAWAALRRGKWIAAALAGLCFGAAYLTRQEGVIYFAVFLVLLIAAWAWKREQGGQNCFLPPRDAVTLQQIVIASVAFALLAAPYVLWLSGQAGRWMWETKSVPNFVTAQRMAAGMSYTEAAYGLTSAGEPAGPFLFRDELLRHPPGDGDLPLSIRLRGALSGLRDEAGLLLVNIGSPLAMVLALFGLLAGHWDVERLRQRGLALLFLAALLFLLPTMAKPLAVLALLGVSWRAWDRYSLARIGFLFAFLLPTATVVSLVPRVYTRYLTPMTGYVALWGGSGLAAGYRWIREAWSGRPRWASVASLLLMLLAMAIVVHSIQGGLLALRPPRMVLDMDQRRAGEWLAAYDPSPGKRIMSVHSQLPFYAGGVHVPMPYAEPGLVQRYAEAQGVDYVVISPRKLRSRPPLEPWTRGEAIPEEWQLVYRDAETSLTIYQIPKMQGVRRR